MESIVAALDSIRGSRNEFPKCIILDTVKGKGVSFMEDVAGWHGKAPNKEQYEQAIREIDGGLN